VLHAVTTLLFLQTPLLDAANAGDLARARAAIENGAGIDDRDGDGRSALSVAALQGDLRMVLYLLEEGADANLKDEAGDTPLLLAAGRNAAVMRALVEAGADVNLANDDGRTPLISAAQYETESVRLLLDAGANVSHQDSTGVTALVVAKASGATEIERLLREAGAVETLEEELHQAIRDGDDAEIARCIAGGADVNAADTDLYETPLMAALRYRRMEALAKLLEAGADPTIEGTGIETEGDNAILVAARDASPWALRALIEHRARPQDLDRALFYGCAHEGILRILLDAGARVNARGERDRTPLMCAASKGAAESVSFLLSRGADPALESDDGSTARDWAEASGHDEVARLLLR
jgi:ankyrin repeat protein